MSENTGQAVALKVCKDTDALCRASEVGEVCFAIISPMEHNSVMRPLTALAQSKGVRIETLPADRFGRIDPSAAAAVADDLSPRLVARIDRDAGGEHFTKP